jgi:hypothetical protein
MENSPLERIVIDKRNDLAMRDYKERTKEQTIIWLTNSINSISIDLANKLIKQGIHPTKVEMTFPVRQRRTAGIFERGRTIDHEVNYAISVDGWLIKHTHSLYGYDTNKPGEWTILASNGAPFSFQYDAQGGGIMGRTSGAEAFARDFINTPTVEFSWSRNKAEIDTFFSQHRQLLLNQYAGLVSPLIEKII